MNEIEGELDIDELREIGVDPEFFIVEEQPEGIDKESPDQKAKRQAAKNLRRATIEALDYIKLQKAKTEFTYIDSVETPKRERMMVWPMIEPNNSFLSKCRRKYLTFLLSKQGYRQPEKMVSLIAYLEANSSQGKLDQIQVSSQSYKQEKDKYHKQGYSGVLLGDLDHDKRVTLERIRFCYYRFSEYDSQSISTIVEKISNPIEVFERLRSFGFDLSNVLLSSHLNLILYLARENSLRVLERLEAIKNRPDRFSLHDNIPWLNEAGSLLGRLTPEKVDQIDKLLGRLGNEFDLREVPDYLDLIEDSRCLKLLAYIYSLSDASETDSFRKEVISRIVRIKNSNLLDPLLGVITSGIDFDRRKLLDFIRYSYFSDSHLDDLSKNLSHVLQSDEYRSLHSNSRLREFTRRAAVVTGKPIALYDLEHLGELQKHPEFLAIANCLRRWGVSGSVTGFCKAIIDHNVTDTILSPEFDGFIESIKGVSNGKYLLSTADLLSGNDKDGRGRLLELFENRGIREFLATPEAKIAAGFFRSFWLSEVETYKNLAGLPDGLSLARFLVDNYQIDFDSYSFAIQSFASVCNNESLKKILMSNEATELHKILKERIGFRFSLYEASEFACLCSNTELKNQLLKEESLVFLGEVAPNSGAKNILECLPILGQEGSKSLALELRHNYDYWLVSSYLPILAEISNNPDIKNRLLNQKKIQALKASLQLTKEHFDLTKFREYLEAPNDFPEFLYELYKWSSKDNIGFGNFRALMKIYDQRKLVFGLLTSLADSGIRPNFAVSHIILLAETLPNLKCDIASFVGCMTNIKEVIPNFVFLSSSHSYIETLGELAQRSLKINEISNLVALIRKSLQVSDDYTVSVEDLSDALFFSDNKKEIEDTVSGLQDLGHRPISDYQKVKQSRLLKKMADFGSVVMCREIRNHFSNFCPDLNSITATIHTQDGENCSVELINPYENLLFNHRGWFFSRLVDIASENRQIPAEFINALERLLRLKNQDSMSEIMEGSFLDNITDYFNKLLQSIGLNDIKSGHYSNFAFDDAVLLALSKEPEKIGDIIDLIRNYLLNSPELGGFYLKRLNEFLDLEPESRASYIFSEMLSSGFLEPAKRLSDKEKFSQEIISSSVKLGTRKSIENGEVLLAFKISRAFNVRDEALETTFELLGEKMTLDTYHVIERLLNNDTDSQFLASLEITKSGKTGISQIRERLIKLRGEVLSEQFNPHGLAPFYLVYLRTYLRVDISQWGNHDLNTFSRTIDQHARLKENGYIAPLAPEYYESGSVRIDTVDKEEQKAFRFSESFLSRWNTLLASIQEAISLTGEKNALSILADRAGVKLTAFIDQLRTKASTPEPNAKIDPDKRKAMIESRIAELSAINLRSVAGFEKNFELLATVPGIDEELRVLLFLIALHRNRQNVNMIKELSHISEPSVDDIPKIMDFVDHITNKEVWHKYFKSKSALKLFGSIVDVKALQEEYLRAQNQAIVGTTTLDFIPTRGPLMEFSGHIADACWAGKAQESFAKEFPNFASVIMVQNRNTKFERIAGACMLIETQALDGTPLLVVRGLNPIENVINSLKVSDFCDKFFSQVKLWADKLGRKAAIVIDNHSGGSSTNRPILYSHLSTAVKPRSAQIRLKSADDTTFNGYNIVDNVYLLS
ncbi:MAG TPA: hypothetical protein PK263_01230 [bacterium]|nr:hypothetical protein [bacterium]